MFADILLHQESVHRGSVNHPKFNHHLVPIPASNLKKWDIKRIFHSKLPSLLLVGWQRGWGRELFIVSLRVYAAWGKRSKFNASTFFFSTAFVSSPSRFLQVKNWTSRDELPYQMNNISYFIVNLRQELSGDEKVKGNKCDVNWAD